MEVEVSIEELRKRKLMVCTPMYGGMCAGTYTKSSTDLAQAAAKYGVELVFFYLFNESLITRARNYCVDTFMRSDCTHMIFLDSDIGFDFNDVLAMLALMSEESDYDIMCAPYPKKTIAWEKIKDAVDRGYADDNPNELDNFVGDFVFNPAAGSGTADRGGGERRACGPRLSARRGSGRLPTFLRPGRTQLDRRRQLPVDRLPVLDPDRAGDGPPGLARLRAG